MFDFVNFTFATKVVESNSLHKLTLSTYFDIMRLGPIFAGFECPISSALLILPYDNQDEENVGKENSKQATLLRDIGEYLVIRHQYCDVFSDASLVRAGRLTWPLAVAVGQVTYSSES